MTTEAERERILDAWAEDNLSAAEIARDVGVQSRCVVLGVVFRARQANDPRAALRPTEERASVQSKLHEAAIARGMSLFALKRRLLRNIARDGLVGAVLDDGRSA